MLGEGALELGDQSVSNAAAVDQHVRLEIHPVKGDDEVVGVGMPRGLERAGFRRRGWDGGSRGGSHGFDNGLAGIVGCS